MLQRLSLSRVKGPSRVPPCVSRLSSQYSRSASSLGPTGPEWKAQRMSTLVAALPFLGLGKEGHGDEECWEESLRVWTSREEVRGLALKRGGALLGAVHLGQPPCN